MLGESDFENSEYSEDDVSTGTDIEDSILELEKELKMLDIGGTNELTSGYLSD